MILCVLAITPIAPDLGIEPIAAVAIAVLAGGLAQAAVQWPALRREGFSYRPALDARDEGLRDILILMGPGIVGLAATQVNLFVNTVLATGEGTGAVSWLSYAFRLMYLPIGLFGVSIATAALPSLSRHAATDATVDMRTTLSSGLRLMLMLNVPATVGLIVLASPIIELIFQYGAFTAADTAATAAALVFYAPGLVGYSAVKLAVPSFYALRDSRTPVVISVGTMVLNIALNISLVRVMGYTGLALGTAVAALANAAALLWLLARRLDGLDGRRIWASFARILVASAVMAAAAVAAEQGLRELAGAGVGARLVRVFGAIAAGVLTLAAAARLLRVEELDEAIRRLRARFLRRTAR
jgi:putative peptidoglycan lipid II flippase